LRKQANKFSNQSKDPSPLEPYTPAEPRGPWPPLASVRSKAIAGASGRHQRPAAACGSTVAAPGGGTRAQQWHAASSSMQLFITIELPSPLHFKASSASDHICQTSYKSNFQTSLSIGQVFTESIPSEREPSANVSRLRHSRMLSPAPASYQIPRAESRARVLEHTKVSFVFPLFFRFIFFLFIFQLYFL
jgi:hypothetical protein